MKMRIKRILSLLIAICLCMPSVSAVAESNRIEDAFNFYPDKQLEAYQGAGWDLTDFTTFTWVDKLDETWMGRQSQGLQKETYDDILLANAEQLKKDGYDPDMSDEDKDITSVGLMGGFIPSYTGSYYNSANNFVRTVLREVGNKEDSFDNRPNVVKYNIDLGFISPFIPWAAVFVSWCANECGLVATADTKPEDVVFTRISPTAQEMFDDLTNPDAGGFDWIRNSEIIQLGGANYHAVPGDIVFWQGNGEGVELQHVGVVTEAGDDYIVITQGDYGRDGLVESITYSYAMPYKTPLSKELTGGKIVHVVYPNSIYTWDTMKTIVAILKSKGLNSAAIAGVVGNLEAESRLVSYRCEGDTDRAGNYRASWDYTKKVDNGIKGKGGSVISKSGFANNGLYGAFADGYTPKGYGLAQFTYSAYKEQLYDLAVKMGRSISDPEVQMICVLDVLSSKNISKSSLSDEGNYGADTITLECWNDCVGEGKTDVSLLDLLLAVPESQVGLLVACNAFARYYENPRELRLERRFSTGYARWEDVKVLYSDENAGAEMEQGGGDNVLDADKFEVGSSPSEWPTTIDDILGQMLP